MMERIHAALNRELIQRLLVRYFTQKGFGEDFNQRVYPPMLQDLIAQVPQLMNKVEIVPYPMELDPMTGVVQLGWNMFVLGNNRMFLGESTHANLNEVRTSIAGPMGAGRRTAQDATPKRIVKFITKVLGSSKSGDISNIPKSVSMKAPLAIGATGEHSGYFRHSQRPVF